jgi:hypothetical protein
MIGQVDVSTLLIFFQLRKQLYSSLTPVLIDQG